MQWTISEKTHSHTRTFYRSQLNGRPSAHWLVSTVITMWRCGSARQRRRRRPRRSTTDGKRQIDIIFSKHLYSTFKYRYLFGLRTTYKSAPPHARMHLYVPTLHYAHNNILCIRRPHTHTHIHTFTHSRTHAHTRARTHAHAHTYKYNEITLRRSFDTHRPIPMLVPSSTADSRSRRRKVTMTTVAVRFWGGTRACCCASERSAAPPARVNIIRIRSWLRGARADYNIITIITRKR